MYTKLDYKLMTMTWNSEKSKDRDDARQKILEYFDERKKCEQKEINTLIKIKERISDFLQEEDPDDDFFKRLEDGYEYVADTIEFAVFCTMLNDYLAHWFESAWESMEQNSVPEDDTEGGLAQTAVGCLMDILLGDLLTEDEHGELCK